MSADLAFNTKLAEAQLTALDALQAIMADTAAPPTADPARVKTTLQLINIRLRSAVTLLRLKPRKPQPETASNRPAATRERAPDVTLAAIEAALNFTADHPLTPTPAPTMSTRSARSLLERAGTPQHVPRPDKAA